MFTLLATTNDKQGNGTYRPLRKRKVSKKAKNADEFSYLNQNTDLRMQFSTSDDPIYFAFECLEQRSVPQLMGDLIQDSLYTITKFVSKVVK